MAAAVVVTAAGTVAVPRLVPEWFASCGEDVVELAAAGSRSPFLDATGRAEQPDRDRDALVSALDGAPAPFGEVLGAVGYHYDQWAQISAFEQGIGIRTRDNPDFTMLDDQTLRPRWSVEVRTKRSTYDASAERYLVTTMPADGPPDLVALDAGTGRRLLCTTLGRTVVRPGDPFATAVLDDEDVAVLAPAGGERELLSRIDGRDGSQVWERTLDAGSGDYLGELAEGKLLVGGRDHFGLFDREAMADRAAGPALVLVSADDGKTIWKRTLPARTDVHVVGTDAATGTAVLTEWSTRAGTALLKAIDVEGNQLWYALPARGTFDVALRSGRIIVRAGNLWSAYDITGGRRLWTHTVPAQPQFLPYGFELDSMPMLDADHVLVGGTTALHVLDLDTGEMTSPAPLPTDGINTTYWPYQLAVSPGLVAVATNTGAVVLRRE